jgi:8-oxo-dGTP pyrophosphatase MutT (NUDIX family)
VAEYVKHLRGIVGGSELLHLPSVSVALRDDAGRVLLARHTEGDVWLLPGGGVEPGETPADAAVREMWEETGFVVRLTRLVGVFGGPDHVVHYRNGDRASYVSATFEAVFDAGSARPDGDEVIEVRFVTRAEAASLRTSPWLPEILDAVFGSPSASSFRPPTWTPPAIVARERTS